MSSLLKTGIPRQDPVSENHHMRDVFSFRMVSQPGCGHCEVTDLIMETIGREFLSKGIACSGIKIQDHQRYMTAIDGGYLLQTRNRQHQ